MDPAITNDLVTQWLFKQIMEMPALLRRKIRAHAEYCFPHGVAIAKGRMVEGKKKGEHANSFTKLLRDGAFKAALVETVRAFTERTLRVEHRPMSRLYEDRAEALFTAVVGNADAEFVERIPPIAENWATTNLPQSHS